MSGGLAVLLTAAPLAFAADYPPNSDAEGQVSPSRISAGQCATFSGKGFLPDVTVEITDNGESRGTATTSHAGKFSKRLCYGADTPAGEHRLRGTGDAPDSTSTSAAHRSFFRMQPAEAAVRRTVTAVLYIDGVQQSQSTTEAGGLTGSTGYGDEAAPGSNGTVGTVPAAGGGSTAVGRAAPQPGADLSLPRADVAATSERLAFTGFPAVLAVLLGTVLVAGGCIVLALTERRHRRRRLA